MEIRSSLRRFIHILVLWILWVDLTEAAGSFQNGVVASVHPLASQAGRIAMERGGNAIDAVVACALTLGVVDTHNSGIGGGCFILIRLADGRVIGMDGRETAPGKASARMYIRNGRAVSELSLHGPLAVGTPGELAALAYVSTNFGRLPLAQHLEMAASIAENGFELSRAFAGSLNGARKEIDRLEQPPEGARPPQTLSDSWPGESSTSLFGEFNKIFLREDGAARTAGEWLRQPDLAKTYRAIALQGTGAFYRGTYAAMTAEWMEQHGGLLTSQDFADYQPRLREIVRTSYRGFEIVGFPPPSSGGLHVAEILNVLQHFDLHKMGDNTADFVHVVTEAMKLAFADRAYWLGDSDFTKVPRGLYSTNYAAKLARKIRMDRATVVPSHGRPPGSRRDVFSGAEPVQKHTTHFTAADSQGNWVACTATINTSFGSKVVVPGTGVVLNNQMDDFSAQPGVPNTFGLVGAKANSIAPRKRPLSSMSPTIVLRNGQPVFSVGAAGGPTIISQSVLALLRFIDFHQVPERALQQPRFHHQWKPDELLVEETLGTNVIQELGRRGHHVKTLGSIGMAQAIGQSGSGLIGASDPRGEGKADGW